MTEEAATNAEEIVRRFDLALADLVGEALRTTRAAHPDVFRQVLAGYEAGQLSLSVVALLRVGRPAALRLLAIDVHGKRTALATLKSEPVDLH